MPTAIPSGITSVATESQRGVTNFADVRTGLFGSGDPSQNYLINGAAEFSQRFGTALVEQSNGTQGYFADRWYGYAGASTTVDFQQSSSALLADFGLVNFVRAWRRAGNTGTATFLIGQIIETANVRALAGKQVTISFYARKGADFSATSSILSVRLFTGTGTDQGLVSRIAGTWTGFDSTRTTDVTLTTAWQRFSVTFTVPLTATEACVEFRAAGTGTAGTNDWFDISGAMLNVGPVALPFQRAGGTIGGELQLCQRYYEKSFNIDTAPANNVAAGRSLVFGRAGTDRFSVLFHIPYKAPKRATSYTYTFYNPFSASPSGAFIRDEGGGANRTHGDVSLSQAALIIENLAVGQTTTTSSSHSVHWAVDSEL